MADAVIAHHDYYVYILFRPDTGVPFYVGKGRKGRWLMHQHHVKPGRSHKDNIFYQARQLGLEVPKVKIAERLTNAEACKIEIAFIAALGREPNGILVNKTAGGEGLADPSDEVRAKKRAWFLANLHRTHSPEAIAKRVIARTGHEVSQETRDKIAQSLRGSKHSPEVIAKRAAAVSKALAGKKRKPYTPERKERRRLEMIEQWKSNPDLRSGFTRKGVKISEETRAKMRAAALGRIISPEQRAKVSANQTGRKQSPATIAKRVETRAKTRAARLSNLAKTGDQKWTTSSLI